MNTEPSLRRACVNDAPQLADVFIHAWRWAYPGIVPNHVLAELNMPDTTAWLTALVADPGFTTIAADQADTVVGFVRYGPAPDEPDCGYIAALYIHPAHTGQALGQMLLDQAIADLRNDGYTQITLWVFEHNPRACRLYERAGFRRDGASKAEKRYGSAPQIRMRWKDVGSTPP